MKETGGPAFAAAVPPTETQVCGIFDGVFQEGMTLRDYFAGCALIGMLASGANIYEVALNSEMSYRNSDAMLVERAKE